MTAVRSLMQRDLALAGPDETVATACRRMSARNLGALLVVEHGTLLGLISERDVLRRVTAEGRDPETTLVRHVATGRPIAVSEDESLEECTRLLRERNFRHLPIVDGEGRPIGIVSARDLLRFVVTGLDAYIRRYRGADRREEMVDPYGTFEDFAQPPREEEEALDDRAATA